MAHSKRLTSGYTSTGSDVADHAARRLGTGPDAVRLRRRFTHDGDSRCLASSHQLKPSDKWRFLAVNSVPDQTWR